MFQQEKAAMISKEGEGIQKKKLLLFFCSRGECSFSGGRTSFNKEHPSTKGSVITFKISECSCSSLHPVPSLKLSLGRGGCSLQFDQSKQAISALDLSHNNDVLVQYPFDN